MISQSQYYEENLYPLQDGVLNTVRNCGTRFFLTGGTALSRAYYKHRYSDDLDFFVNNDDEYDEQYKLILGRLAENGFFWDTETGFLKDKAFATLKVRWKKSDAELKLDFVNDTVPHFGNIIEMDLFDRIDSVRNMLSNKLGALFRFAAKDIADIREIALHESVNWIEIIREAREKVGGLEIPVICDILKGMPESEFEQVNWISKPSWQTFCADIDRVVYEMMSGGE
ncbi:nucleotidyl transferase AbiEii/AbiGii toxin family protein [Leadbettera azotonutricia]|uniref:Nucleotidyl transferase AbiEii/AbiGii toxin family protein n=1 Tax=Leadbettera azotonutricia (strain ATCC BAA-888 / DSM 13862 / ZAS-9) TaxID=545695 RepID=F5YB24_LEAAZ|nr:nucleotidyl transferase AbiEii/AbiGii toxin family protein [Leadbettera azotonutricia]AEF80882.1 conserved hypothetical protein [Leadbettera azotonutricia ZAS-9]